MSLTILVADAADARIFSAENRNSPLIEIRHLKNASGHKLEHDLISDLSGRILSRGGGSHSYAAAESHKHLSEQQFAGKIMNFITSLQEDNNLGHLIILASPTFLGELRQLIPKTLNDSVLLEKARDLTKMDATQIQQHLGEYFHKEHMK